MSVKRDSNCESPPIIGIDLGTTYSSIACYKQGKIEVIPDKYGKRVIPSLVYFHPDNQEVSVGTTAYNDSLKCPTNLLKDSKRILGRKFDDESILKYKKNLSKFSFNIVEGSDGEAAFQIEVNGKKIVKTPEEVSAEILKYLKAIAKEYLMEDVTEAVISIPAHFSNAQRKATKKAAELAGLTVTKFVTEPVAGAIRYSLNKNIKSKLAVFDWGGGTLDISFIELDNKTFEVKSVYGDTLLGGRNIDDILVKHFEKPVNRNPHHFHRRLLNKCIKLKKQLTVSTNATFVIECYDGINDLSLNLTRTEFEKLNEKVFEAAMDLMKYGVHDIGWDKSEINEVVLIGGSTRIPKIREMLEIFFGNDKIKFPMPIFHRNILRIFRFEISLKTDLHPDEAVVCGACIQAASLNELNDLEKFALNKITMKMDQLLTVNNSPSELFCDKFETSKELSELDKYQITEITPLSLGARIHFGLMTVLIPRNSKIPIAGRHSFVTATNNQSECSFIIYEGERKNVQSNNEVASVIVRDLPPGRAGDVVINLTYHLDADGILSLSFDIPLTKSVIKSTVTLEEHRLTQNKIARSIEEAKVMKHEDDLFEQFVKLRQRIGEKCNYILYDIEKISPEHDKILVKKRCEVFLSDMKKFTYLEKKKFVTHLLYFRHSIKNILHRSSLGHLLP